jgi:hypothetical protein
VGAKEHARGWRSIDAGRGWRLRVAVAAHPSKWLRRPSICAWPFIVFDSILDDVLVARFEAPLPTYTIGALLECNRVVLFVFETGRARLHVKVPHIETLWDVTSELGSMEQRDASMDPVAMPTEFAPSENDNLRINDVRLTAGSGDIIDALDQDVALRVQADRRRMSRRLVFGR